MSEMNDVMKSVFPGEVLSEIAKAIPDECKNNIIIIGSLAVGYHFFAGNGSMVVRTKDADCLLSPRIRAVPAGEAIAEKLFDSGWSIKEGGEWNRPGDENTPPDKLPAIRLNPPGNTDWFIELLTVPESSKEREKKWLPFKTSRGYFGLPSFGFLSLTNYDPIKTELGIYVARPAMMALANMLEHPSIGPDLMSGMIQGRRIKRSNKDLGRVLAIAYLSTGKDEDIMTEWPKMWRKALQNRFPDDWQNLARNTGSGIRQLLQSETDLEESYHTCRYGLLASQPPTMEQLKIAGRRLLQDAVEPLEKTGGLKQ
jgi:hypothetical protein